MGSRNPGTWDHLLLLFLGHQHLCWVRSGAAWTQTCARKGCPCHRWWYLPTTPQQIVYYTEIPSQQDRQNQNGAFASLPLKVLDTCLETAVCFSDVHRRQPREDVSPACSCAGSRPLPWAHRSSWPAREQLWFSRSVGGSHTRPGLHREVGLFLRL